MSEQNAEISPFLSESHVGPFISEFNLRPTIIDVLTDAKARGSISPREISTFIPQSVQQDRQKFKAVMAWVAKLLRGINVVIVLDAPHIKARGSRSPVTSYSERQNFRIVQQEEESEIERPPAPIGPYEDYDVYLPDLTKGIIDHEERVGLFYKKIQTIRLLTSNETIELVTDYQKTGDVKARNKVVVHNLRWCMKIADTYRKRMPFDDCFQEGVIGLMKTVEKFDCSKGFRFSTYATWWIRQSITRAIVNQASIIRVPVHMYELRVRVLHAACELAYDLRREPTLEEVSAKCGDPIELVDRALNQLGLPVMSLDELVETQNFHDDSAESLYNFVSDTQTLDPLEHLNAEEELENASDQIRVLIATLQALPLPERHKEVFKKYYGLGGYAEDETLQSVSEGYGVTRERIRQLNQVTWRALRKAGFSMDDEKLMDMIKHVHDLEDLVYREASHEILPRNLETMRQNALAAEETALLPLETEIVRLPRTEIPQAGYKETLTIDALVAYVAGVYSVPVSEVRGTSRERQFVWPRHISMYLARNDLGLSFPKIGLYFNRDHTMIVYACARIQSIVSTDSGIRGDIEKIRLAFKQAADETRFAPGVENTAWGRIVRAIIEAVSQKRGVPIPHILERGKRRIDKAPTVARHLAVYLLGRDFSGQREEIASVLNFKDLTSVSAICTAFEDLLKENTEMQKQIAEIRSTYSLALYDFDVRALQKRQTILHPRQRIEALEIIEGFRARVRALELKLKMFGKSERNREIFRIRYGFEGSFALVPYQEIGDRYGLTRERIRQILDTLWEKLRTVLEPEEMVDDRLLQTEMERISSLQELIAHSPG